MIREGLPHYKAHLGLLRSPHNELSIHTLCFGLTPNWSVGHLDLAYVTAPIGDRSEGGYGCLTPDIWRFNPGHMGGNIAETGIDILTNLEKV